MIVVGGAKPLSQPSSPSLSRQVSMITYGRDRFPNLNSAQLHRLYLAWRSRATILTCRFIFYALKCTKLQSFNENCEEARSSSVLFLLCPIVTTMCSFLIASDSFNLLCPIYSVCIVPYSYTQLYTVVY